MNRHVKTAILFLSTAALIGCFMVINLAIIALWVWYAGRGPVGRPAVACLVDLRSDKRESKYFLRFCCRDSANPIGFPGHCYVVWEGREPLSGDCTPLSAGLYPRKNSDQLIAIFRNVPSMLVREPVSANPGNVDCSLVVCVNAATFAASARGREAWRKRSFRVGRSDCVTFMHSIAQTAGLETPEFLCRFPQSYCHELKELNVSYQATGR